MLGSIMQHSLFPTPAGADAGGRLISSDGHVSPFPRLPRAGRRPAGLRFSRMACETAFQGQALGHVVELPGNDGIRQVLRRMMAMPSMGRSVAVIDNVQVLSWSGFPRIARNKHEHCDRTRHPGRLFAAVAKPASPKEAACGALTKFH